VVSQIVFDESLVEQLEALYATRDVLRRRALVHEALGARSGERILDAGCGPGFYVSELLDRVGPRGSVVGVDASPQMLAVAAKRCEGHANVTFREAAVSALPLDDASFDRALSVQVLEYVADVGIALSELHRVVRPGGRVVVWDVDWTTVSWHSSDPARMERVLRAWDDHLAHTALPRTLAAHLRGAGFEDVQVMGHTFASAEYVSDAYGASLMPVIERYVAGHEAVGPDVAKAWGDDQRDLGARGEFFFACVQFCFAATRP
jgi:arsenite methyltransferase